MKKVSNMSGFFFFQLSTSKGLIAGNLRYIEEDGTKVYCSCTTVSINVFTCFNSLLDSLFLKCILFPALSSSLELKILK